MPVFTNRRIAPCGINLVDPVTLAPKVAFIMPGQSVRGVPPNPADPVLRGMINAGHLEVADGDIDFSGQVTP